MGAMALPPGFRFHPTDEELVGYYLKRKIQGLKMELEVIPEIELYKFDPWQLPDKSFLPKRDLEWFFFCPRDKKYPNGSRTNRATKSGYWKATGKDRPVVCHDSSTGLKKTLVFYLGRAPLGDRTDWVMHEYRLYDGSTQGLSISESPFALCRIVKRSDQGQKIGDHPAETKKKRSLSSIMRDANSVRRASEVQTSPLQQMVFPAACSAEQLSDTSSRNSNLYTSEFSISLDPVGAPRTEISDLSCNNPTVNNLLNDQSTENQSETWCSANPPVGASILLPEENRLDLGVYSSQIGVMTPHRRDINDPQMMFEPDAFLYQNFEFPEQRRNAAFHNMGFDTRNVVTTPPICREASLDGNLGEICGMWFGEDGSVAVV